MYPEHGPFHYQCSHNEAACVPVSPWPPRTRIEKRMKNLKMIMMVMRMMATYLRSNP